MTGYPKLISEREISFGCVLREEEHLRNAFEFTDVTADAEDTTSEMQSISDTASKTFTMVSGYNAKGHYIGNEKDTRYLCLERKICPELADPTHSVCSIGYCEHERKWYGWSHRAIFGFEVGSVITKADCGYLAPDKETFGQQMLDFFCDNDGWQTDGSFRDAIENGISGVMLEWTYTDKVPNEKLRGTCCAHFYPYPKEFGRGEWVVSTKEEAKQAACDFAESVS